MSRKSAPFFSGQDIVPTSGREAEISAQRSPLNLPPFLSKLQIFPSKLRRNDPKWLLISRQLQRAKKNKPSPTPEHQDFQPAELFCILFFIVSAPTGRKRNEFVSWHFALFVRGRQSPYHMYTKNESTFRTISTTSQLV